MKVQKFEYCSNSYIDSMSNDFINFILNNNIQESSDNKSIWSDLHNKVTKELSLNFGLLTTFGGGINGLYPIIDHLVKNMNLNITITPEMIANLTVCAVAIIYLEENKNVKDKEKLTQTIKSELEEFRMQGIYGVVKKVINCIKSIKHIFIIIAKHTGTVIKTLIDMLGYTALLLPILNSIISLITKYKIDLDTLPGNFL